jgi:hypothetical protein
MTKQSAVKYVLAEYPPPPPAPGTGNCSLLVGGADMAHGWVKSVVRGVAQLFPFIKHTVWGTPGAATT